MTDTPYPHLFSPLRVGPVELRNRVVSTSHQTHLVVDNLPSPAFVAYQEARARGGAGAIFIEATAVHPSGLLTHDTLGGYLPAIVDHYRSLGDIIRGHGSRLFLQLFHGGREVITGLPRSAAIAPSAVPSQRFLMEPRAMTLRDIAETIDCFGLAARHAREGRIDGLEVSMSHGYLGAQFLSARSNHRDDEYALEHGLRFAIEVLTRVREEAGPDLAVGVRLAADEQTPEGLGPAECARIARAIAESGVVDFLDLALGNSSTAMGAIGIVPPSPVEMVAIAEPAAATRSQARGIPIIATTRVHDLADAERLVADGIADAVGMTRAQIADPDLVTKALEGREQQTIRCIGCNQACIGHYHEGLPVGCVVNPRTGRELTLPRPSRSDAPLRVAVIGAGPTGLAAALEAARHGHDVVLFEREDAIGGQFRLAGTAYAHAEVWRRYQEDAERDLAALGVDVRLGAEATAADVADADRVILATGAQPYRPPRLAEGPYAIVQAWDAISHPAAIEGPVLIADWGGEYAGVDAAEVLARAGHDVTLACAAPTPGAQVHQYQRALYLKRLDELGVRILHHTELNGDGSRLRHVYSERAIPFGEIGTLVLSQGRVPEDALWADLEGDPRVIRVGDILSPRGLEEAVLEGTLAIADPAQATGGW